MYFKRNGHLKFIIFPAFVFCALLEFTLVNYLWRKNPRVSSHRAPAHLCPTASDDNSFHRTHTARTRQLSLSPQRHVRHVVDQSLNSHYQTSNLHPHSSPSHHRFIQPEPPTESYQVNESTKAKSNNSRQEQADVSVGNINALSGNSSIDPLNDSAKVSQEDYFFTKL